MLRIIILNNHENQGKCTDSLQGLWSLNKLFSRSNSILYSRETFGTKRCIYVPIHFDLNKILIFYSWDCVDVADIRQTL